MKATFESSSSIGLLEADDALAGVFAEEVMNGEHAGSGLQPAFVLGGGASLQFAVMARLADRRWAPRDEGDSSATALALA
jgi:hypothetical protein